MKEQRQQENEKADNIKRDAGNIMTERLMYNASRNRIKERKGKEE